MNKKILTTLLALIVVFLLFCVAASALDSARPLDFGDFGGGADYGGGNDGGDYGGGDYGGDISGIFFLIGDLPTPILIILIVLIIIFAARKNAKKNGNAQGPVVNVPKATPASALRPMESYKQLDPNFSEADMQSKISNIFVRLQAAWTAKDLTDVRTCLTDEFFAQTDRQLDAYRNNNQTNIIERIAVLGVTLTGWDQNDKNDMIVARLNARMADYVIDDATKNIVRGSKTADRFMEYEWTLVRSTGKQTGVDNEKERKNCPYCGAPLDINRTAKCEYCGNIISTNDYDWCLASIKGLSQRTVGN